MTKVLVYTAYPEPLDKAAKVGNVYNSDGGVVWDCRCGARGLLAGGMSDHECFATREDSEAIALQEQIASLGEETTHPNTRAIDREEIPDRFLAWLSEIGEAQPAGKTCVCLDCGKDIFLTPSREQLCNNCFYSRLV